MVMDDRPPPSPEKLLRQFEDWLSGEELPGRTMSYLKTGFLPELLEGEHAAEGVEAMRASWASWEAGTTDPTAVLEVLRDDGLEPLLVRLAGA